MTIPNIHTIVASAGAGKTTRIVTEIADEVTRRDPESLLATTFTVKAADELIERSRARLFGQGQAARAARLLGARFGTVNSVCGQIATEFALDLGRSPQAEVIPPESAERVFAVAADAAIGRHADSLNRLAEAFGANEPKAPGTKGVNWRDEVRSIIALARANGIDAADLAQSAAHSAAGFSALLRAPAGTAVELDGRLLSALEAAAPLIPETPSAGAKDSIVRLRRALVAMRRGEPLIWPVWAQLTKLKCAKKDGEPFVQALERIASAAAAHPSHPRLHEQTAAFIHEVFACAAEAMDAYQDHKARRGLLDFTDQETLALDILRTPSLAARIAERLDRVFVDEFQDSSPLQVAVFTALASLVEQSTWVGDPKQAIYGFRGADSALTQAAFEGARTGGVASEPLTRSWRSRADIIGLVNGAFWPAFDQMNLGRDENAFSDTARDETGLDRNALSVWRLAGKTELQFTALAEKVRKVLASPEEWLVAQSDRRCPIAAGDIAVLCRTGAHVAAAAEAFGRLGIPVAVERQGLMRTPHVEVVMAAFRYIADRSDSLALAELARFFSADPEDDSWLEAAADADPMTAMSALVPIAASLDRLRHDRLALTPAEMLDAVIVEPGVMALIGRWGDMATRLDDLEALRGFARAYENECASAASPASLSGLMLALASQDPERPRSLRSDAVRVMTYHGAKGLEWPLVIMTGLSRAPTARLFEPVARSSGEVDWLNPLEGRWIRYWPWPYGSQKTGVSLDDEATNSDDGRQALIEAGYEETRLLYVGMTRARDYLVLAPPEKGALAWLDVLNTADATPLRLPSAAGAPLIAGDASLVCDMEVLEALNETVARTPAPSFGPTPREGGPMTPLRLTPSHAVCDSSAFVVTERIRLGGRLPITGAPDMARLGEAVHAIMATDHNGHDRDARLTHAKGVLARWGVCEIQPEDMLEAAERLHGFVKKTWPDAIVRHETPVVACIGEQIVEGRIDLLAEGPVDLAVVDHKSFPGAPDQWEGRALSYAPQLHLYGQAAAAAAGRPCTGLYVHMPVVGMMLKLEAVPPTATEASGL